MAKDNRRGIGKQHKSILITEAPIVTGNFDTKLWERTNIPKGSKRPIRINISFLDQAHFSKEIAIGFWCRYSFKEYTNATITAARRVLLLWSRFSSEIGNQQLSFCTLFPLYSGWLAKRLDRQRISQHLYILASCYAEALNMNSEGSGNWVMEQNKELVSSCFARGQKVSKTGKSLPDDIWHRLLKVANEEIEKIFLNQPTVNMPPEAKDLVPFMIMVSAHTGANADPLLEFQRDAWRPAAVLEGYWRLSWIKRRAKGREEQNLLFPEKNKTGKSVIDLLNFIKNWTSHLSTSAEPGLRNDLWLYKGRYRAMSASPMSSSHGTFSKRHIVPWMKKRGFNIPLGAMRPNAAITLLRSGKSLTHVQNFLQHASSRSTWLYLRSDVLRPEFNNVITTTQSRILGLIIPTSRTQAVEIINTASSGQTLITGEWDVGTCACSNPLASPLPGEVQGRVCRSFHACYFCPNAVWFKEHLPLEIWKLKRMELTKDTDPYWHIKYAHTCDVIKRDILGAFSEADRQWADRKASDLATSPVLIANGVTL